MPDREVKTVRDSSTTSTPRSSPKAPWEATRRSGPRFSAKIASSSTLRRFAFIAAPPSISPGIISSLAINERCSSCDRIQGIHKKYLKTIYYCHECRGTLDWEGNGDGLSVLDLDL